MDALFGPPPPYPDEDRGPIVYRTYWALFAVGALFTSLRFYARIKIRFLGWDDWIMALTTLLLLALTIAGTFLALDGGCRHLYYLVADGGLDAAARVNKIFYICQPFALMDVALGRVSVAVLILRIVGQSVWQKRFLWFSIVSTLLTSAINSIMLFTACSPVEGLWNPVITAKCWRPEIMTDVTIFASCWNVFIDVCLALLPISIFWKLKLDLKKRVALSALMSGGLLAAISGAIKTSKLFESISSDPTWASYDLLLWHGAETILIIVCGCIPTLKPIYDMCFGHHNSRSTARSSYQYRQKRKIDSDDSGSHDEHIRLDTPNKSFTDPTGIRVAHSVDVNVGYRTESDTLAPMSDPYIQWRRNSGDADEGPRKSSQYTGKRGTSGEAMV